MLDGPVPKSPQAAKPRATERPRSTCTGKRLHTAHAGRGISAIDFEVFVDVLAKALHRRGIRGREKAELLLIVRRARADIVEP